MLAGEVAAAAVVVPAVIQLNQEEASYAKHIQAPCDRKSVCAWRHIAAAVAIGTKLMFGYLWWTILLTGLVTQIVFIGFIFWKYDIRNTSD